MQTPQQIQIRLEEIEGQMALNANDLESAAKSYFGLKRERDVARAKLLLAQVGGTVTEREAQALVQLSSSDLFIEFVKSEADYESLKLAQRSLADRASIGQSILGFQKVAR